MPMALPYKTGSPSSHSLHRVTSSAGYPVLFYSNPPITAANTVPDSPSSAAITVFLCRLFTAAAISILVCSLVALILFLILHPKLPTLRVDSAVLMESNSSPTQFSLTFLFVNPNTKVSVSYSVIDAFLRNSSDGDVAMTSLPPFSQSRREWTRVTAQFDLGQDGTFVINNNVSNNGSLEFGIKLITSVKFNYGVFRAGHRELKAACYPLKVVFGARNNNNNNNNGTGNVTAVMHDPSDWCSV
ncbi:NDR1/HIN1-like protein 1 [Arachis stenosperma]|uniref:NDR1/HIN1-like protein 1 n=1 Tax=Arachis stenosperma TaxID=217475 RepID=UPI0025AC7BAD|nr:NDR1/HIN1-like protein 1 [Arachis stenosperma]